MSFVPIRKWASNSSSALSLATPSLSPSAVGNLLVVMAGVSITGHTMGISDTQGNTWIPANPNFDDATNNQVMRSWYALAKATTSNTITVTNSALGFISVSFLEASGVDQVASLDQVTHSAAGSSGTPISPSFTPLFDDELVIAYTLDTCTAVGNIDTVPASDWADDLAGDWMEWRVLRGRAGIPMTAAFTGSGTNGVLVATFKPALLSGPTTRSSRSTAKTSITQQAETAAC